MGGSGVGPARQRVTQWWCLWRRRREEAAETAESAQPPHQARRVAAAPQLANFAEPLALDLERKGSYVGPDGGWARFSWLVQPAVFAILVSLPGQIHAMQKRPVRLHRVKR